VTRKIRKTCRAGGTAGVDQTQIKKAAGQPRKQIPELDAIQQSPARPAHERGTRPEENEGDLADLVWKYFAEEITQALIDIQEAPALDKGAHARQVLEKAREMSKSRFIRANTRFVGIRKSGSYRSTTLLRLLGALQGSAVDLT